jgi:excinuclease ABC subunit B
VVRPTGVVDPSVTVVNASKAGGLEDHLLAAVSKAEGRALVTCLTKRSAEALADFLTSHGIPAAWLHADLDSQKRLKVLDALRRGDLKAVVGCNLLREGLDLPQVSLVAIVGAEKRGYLRSATSLIQTIGRAARHVNGEVLLYTDNGFVSDSMREAIEETNRRRGIQLRYNENNCVTPRGAAAAGGDATDALAELLGPGPGPGPMRELPVFEDPTDEALHVALREWRKATAAANRKRPFRVFPERTLQDLVAKKPTTTSELKKVWGLGPARLARHGDEVLAVVREYVVSR